MTSQSFTGIGQSKVPTKIQNVLTQFAKVMDNHGFILRSGGDCGVDDALEKGFEKPMVYLPWNGFNDKEGSHYMSREVKLTAASIHPYWRIINSETRLLLERDIVKVLSPTLDKPVRFIIAWNPEHTVKAKHSNNHISNIDLILMFAINRGIPVINMVKEKNLELINKVIETNSLVPLGLSNEPILV